MFEKEFFCLFVCFFFLLRNSESKIESRAIVQTVISIQVVYLYIKIRLVPQGVSLYHSTGRARRTSPCDVIIVSRICVKFVVLRGKIAFKITSLRDVGRSGSFGAFTFTLLYHV